MNKNIPVGITITPENKCGYCTNSKCCTYITEELVTPRSMHDFDHLLWQLSHKDVQAYKDEDGWYLLVNNPCAHLQADGHCGIYDDRRRSAANTAMTSVNLTSRPMRVSTCSLKATRPCINMSANASRPGASTPPAGTSGQRTSDVSCSVIPANAGIHTRLIRKLWIPALRCAPAGMTD